MLWSGIARQPSSPSNSVLMAGGPKPSRRSPPSNTPKAMAALTKSASRTLRAFIAQLTIWVTESPSCRRWKTVSAIFFFASASTTKLFMNR